MKCLLKGMLLIVIVVAWLIGAVISKGFWSCSFAMCFPPYAWYLVVEKMMLVNGWLQ